MKCWGKYRGVVTNIADPEGLGRLKASIPAILGDGNETDWAWPCFPFTGDGQGFYCVPPVGAGVWIEFEGGDVDYPVWVGGWYSKPQGVSEVPTADSTERIIAVNGTLVIRGNPLKLEGLEVE